MKREVYFDSPFHLERKTVDGQKRVVFLDRGGVVTYAYEGETRYPGEGAILSACHNELETWLKETELERPPRPEQVTQEEIVQWLKDGANVDEAINRVEARTLEIAEWDKKHGGKS